MVGVRAGGQLEPVAWVLLLDGGDHRVDPVGDGHHEVDAIVMSRMQRAVAARSTARG
jgi:hypothetical protein